VVQETPASVAETTETSQQLLFDRKLTHMSGINTKFLPIRQTWIDNFENTDPLDKRGMISLHPLIFSTYPRVDKIHECVEWQQKYREVCICLFCCLPSHDHNLTPCYDHIR
jgi:hypothetical protein